MTERIVEQRDAAGLVVGRIVVLSDDPEVIDEICATLEAGNKARQAPPELVEDLDAKKARQVAAMAEGRRRKAAETAELEAIKAAEQLEAARLAELAKP